MHNIEQTFRDKKAFVGYLTGGDGGIDYCVDCCLALVEGGVDILEIGLPFSDPVGDGPVIQQATQRALEQGTTPETILKIARRLRQHTATPLVLMSYYNPLLQAGTDYLQQLKNAGFDAVLVVDLPPPHPFFLALKDAEIQSILLAAATTEGERLKQIGSMAEGFLYYVCQKGPTGMRKQLSEDFALQVSRLRQSTRMPIAAGFGIGDRASAAGALEHADGFIVGSAFVKLVAERAHPSELKALARAIDPR